MLARHWTCVARNIASRTSSLLQLKCELARESLSQPSAAPTGLVFFQAHPGPGADRGYEGCDGGVSGTSRRQWHKQQIQRSKFTQQADCQAASRAFDLAFDLRRTVKPRWPESDVDSQGKPAGRRFSRTGPGMALCGDPANQYRITGMPSTSEGPSGGARAFCLLLGSFQK